LLAATIAARFWSSSIAPLFSAWRRTIGSPRPGAR
jgi:hypothetical protein